VQREKENSQVVSDQRIIGRLGAHGFESMKHTPVTFIEIALAEIVLIGLTRP
jgi:hypothetical protein